MTAPVSDPAALLTALKGQTLCIPNLASLLRAWPPPATNPHYRPSLQPLVADTIARLAAHRPPLRRRLDDDIALLSALWFPVADTPRAETLALFAVWLVCWDDEVDANEGDLSGDLARADAWRAQTLRVFQAALALPGAPGNGADADADALNATLVAFGARFAPSATVAQRRRLLSQADFFIRSCASEQRLRLSGGAVPPIDSYMALRLGTVGGGLLCALVEYAVAEALPPAALQTDSARLLEEQVGVLLGLLNDLLSLKKELGAGCVLNAVAALLTPSSSLRGVVEEVVARMRDAVKVFDGAAEQMLREAGEEEDARRSVRRYVEGCRALVTGTLEFTLRSPRYGIAKLLREDGSLEIVL